MNAEVDFCGLSLAHPVLNGSGTFDALAALRTFGDALLESFPFALYLTKTVTLAPRAGNPPPRLWEAPAGLVNSIGLPNRGLAAFLAGDLAELSVLPVPIGVSVMGFSRSELVQLVRAVAERDEVALVELNVSCPNVETGLVMGADPEETARAVERVRPATSKPLLVKLTPNATDPAAVALAAVEAGADALSLVNTLKGAALAPGGHGLWLGAGTGGLSGPSIRAVALQQVWSVCQAVDVPVVGMGGVASGAHAAALLELGATCVGVGTENFRDPAAGLRVARELADLSRESPAIPGSMGVGGGLPSSSGRG